MASGYGTYIRQEQPVLSGYGPDGMRTMEADMKTAMPTGSEHSLLRSGGLPRQRAVLKVWELIFVPWFFLVLVLACYIQAGMHGQRVVLWLVPAVLLPLCFLFMRHHYRTGNNPEVVLGLLVTTAICISLIPGAYINMAFLPEYYRLQKGGSYFGVLPTEPAAGKLDAATIVFTESSLVDTSRSFGFTDALTDPPTMYCVAPIANGEDATSTDSVQFWVVGTDCCKARTDFACGKAQDANAHGAVVLPQDMQQSEGFRKAISGAVSAFDIPPSDHYLLTEWSASPVAYTNSLWLNSLHLVCFFAGAYLLISMMVGCALVPVIFGK